MSVRSLKFARAAGAILVVVIMAASSLFAATPPAMAATSASQFSYTSAMPLTRSTLIDGIETITDRRTVSLQVDITSNLLDQQRIKVTWSGAHPTNNYVSDPSDYQAYVAEYPMVLLQCRDVPVNGVLDPINPQVDPTTCWSPWEGNRTQNNRAGGQGGAFPPWRMDRYATAQDREQYANEPADGTASCREGYYYQGDTTPALAQYQLPFLGADGTRYYGSGTYVGCGARPAESTIDSVSATIPDNAQYAATAADGTGSALFNVRDQYTNASIGCSATVPCSLVAVPIMGISCDAGAGLPAADRAALTPDAEKACELGQSTTPGTNAGFAPSMANYSSSGALWWSASNWRNHITVPLSFAPSPNDCQNTNQPVTFYGSELAARATGSWSEHFCQTASSRPLVHVQSGEPLARRAMSRTAPSVPGAAKAVFTTQTGDATYQTATVHAPVAATGFAVSYSIDATSSPATPANSLRLTPRLLAKLLTESYPATLPATGSNGWSYTVTGSDPEQIVTSLRKNPINISYDPEFKALNPGISTTLAPGAAALLSLGSESDVLWSLTNYITNDPEARAWLDGTPDPWGMVVNPNYKGISLPVNLWPLLDRWATAPVKLSRALDYDDWAQAACATVATQPAVLAAIGSPLQRLADTAQSTLYAQPGSLYSCKQNTDYLTSLITSFEYTREKRANFGFRFVIALTSLGDASKYRLSTAELQTQSAQDPNAKYTNGGDRTFVAPSTSSLAVTAAMLKYDPATLGWPTPYQEIRTTALGAMAYPGFMMVYADVPTSGLPDGDGAAYADTLKYMASSGQVPGNEAGQLPDGYLPLNASSGLQAQATFTQIAAANAVANQQGAQPRPDGTDGAPPASPAPASDSQADSSGLDTTGQSTEEPSTSGDSSPGSSADSSDSDSGIDSLSAAGPQTSGSSSPAQASSASNGTSAGMHTAIAAAILTALIALLLLGPLGAPLLIFLQRRRQSL